MANRQATSRIVASMGIWVDFRRKKSLRLILLVGEYLRRSLVGAKVDGVHMAELSVDTVMDVPRTVGVLHRL